MSWENSIVQLLLEAKLLRMALRISEMLYVVRLLVDRAPHSFIHSFNTHFLQRGYGPDSVLSPHESDTASIQVGRQTITVHWWRCFTGGRSDHTCPGEIGIEGEINS